MTAPEDTIVDHASSSHLISNAAYELLIKKKPALRALAIGVVIAACAVVGVRAYHTRAASSARSAQAGANGNLSESTGRGDSDRGQRSDKGSTRTISIEITSTPAGAQVLHPESKTLLGQTPWRGSMPAQDGSYILLLKKHGYRQQALELNASRSAFFHEVLTPAATRNRAPSRDAVDPRARHQLDEDFRINPRR